MTVRKLSEYPITISSTVCKEIALENEETLRYVPYVLRKKCRYFPGIGCDYCAAETGAAAAAAGSSHTSSKRSPRTVSPGGTRYINRTNRCQAVADIWGHFLAL